MTTTEKLERIKAKCRELLSDGEGRAKYDKQAIAGWRSTLAAIEFAAECEEDGYKAHSLTEAILSAWPDDLL